MFKNKNSSASFRMLGLEIRLHDCSRNVIYLTFVSTICLNVFYCFGFTAGPTWWERFQPLFSFRCICKVKTRLQIQLTHTQFIQLRLRRRVHSNKCQRLILQNSGGTV